MSETLTYIGKDLEAMSFAENYHRWILEMFRPYLGRRVVEVGAGTGAMSELLLEGEIESMALVEPSREMFQQLCERVTGLKVSASVATYNDIFARVADEIKVSLRPDSVIYVNVLEHIENDEAELEIIREVLPAHGRAFIFVPAFAWLYGNFDRQIGHFRRYTKNELEEKCNRAGFRIMKSGYFDVAGILPWWIKFRLFRSDSMERGAVKFYDRWVVPVARAGESVITPPVGKNIFLVAERV
jgi:SAM-dependent methyltransferase